MPCVVLVRTVGLSDLDSHASAVEQALMARVESFEAWKSSSKLTTLDDASERNIGKTVLDMETYVSTLINDPPTKKSDVDATIEQMMREEVKALIDSKLRTAICFPKGGTRDDANSRYKSVLQCKALQEIGAVADAKQYLQWHKKMKVAHDQIRLNSRFVLDCVEKLIEDKINDANRIPT